MSRQEDVYGLFPETFYVAQGASALVLIDFKEKQVAGVLDYLSGGTLYVIGGATAGQTLTPAQGTAIFAGGTALFLVKSGQPISISGWPRFYLCSMGATSQVQILRGEGQNY